MPDLIAIGMISLILEGALQKFLLIGCLSGLVAGAWWIGGELAKDSDMMPGLDYFAAVVMGSLGGFGLRAIGVPDDWAAGVVLAFVAAFWGGMFKAYRKRRGSDSKPVRTMMGTMMGFVGVVAVAMVAWWIFAGLIALIAK